MAPVRATDWSEVTTDTRVEELAIVVATYEKRLWEARLSLWVRPRPAWIPRAAWRWMVNQVLYQTERGGGK